MKRRAKRYRRSTIRLDRLHLYSRTTRAFFEPYMRPARPFRKIDSAPFYTVVEIENPALACVTKYKMSDPLPRGMMTFVSAFRIPEADYQRHWDLEGPHA